MVRGGLFGIDALGGGRRRLGRLDLIERRACHHGPGGGGVPPAFDLQRVKDLFAQKPLVVADAEAALRHLNDPAVGFDFFGNEVNQIVAVRDLIINELLGVIDLQSLAGATIQKLNDLEAHVPAAPTLVISPPLLPTPPAPNLENILRQRAGIGPGSSSADARSMLEKALLASQIQFTEIEEKLEDADPAVRAGALKCLKDFHRPEVKGVPAVKYLTDRFAIETDSRVRLIIGETLITGYGTEGTSAYYSLVQKQREVVQQQIAGLFGRLQRVNRDALQALGLVPGDKKVKVTGQSVTAQVGQPIEDAVSNLAHFQRMLVNLDEEVSKISLQLSRLVDSASAKAETAAADLRTSQATVADRDSTITQFRADLQAAQTDLQTAQAGLQTAQADIGTRDDAIRLLRNDLSAVGGREAAAQQGLRERDETIRVIRKQLATLGDKLTVAERDAADVPGLRSDLAAARAAVAEGNRMIDELGRNLQAARATAGEVPALRAELEAKQVALRTVEIVAREVPPLRAELAAARAAVKVVPVEPPEVKLNERAQAIHTRLSELKSAQAALEGRQQAAVDELRDADEAVLPALKGYVAEKEAAIESRQEALRHQHAAEIETLDQQIAAVEAALSGIEGKSRLVEIRRQAEKIKLEQLWARRNGINQRLEAAFSQDTEISVLIAEKAQHQKNLGELEVARRELVERIDAINRELRQNGDALGDVHAEAATLADDIHAEIERGSTAVKTLKALLAKMLKRGQSEISG